MRSNNLSQLTACLQATLPSARIEVVPLPGCPEIQLGLINADFPTGPLPPDVMHAVIAQPAYWAFCWGSGLALARRILQNPETVVGQKVADLGSGSGVVAIAAALAGAKQVWVCDNDSNALLATLTNAGLNKIEVNHCNDLAMLSNDFDTLFMADVLYDRSNFALIDAAMIHANHVVIADSRIAKIEDGRFREVGTDTGLTYPNLGEFDEFKTVRFFESISSG